MGDKFTELRDDTVAAFEESTGDLPSDVEMGQISMLVNDYLSGEGEQ